MTDTPFHPNTPRNRGNRDAAHVSPVTPAEDARTVLLRPGDGPPMSLQNRRQPVPTLLVVVKGQDKAP